MRRLCGPPLQHDRQDESFMVCLALHRSVIFIHTAAHVAHAKSMQLTVCLRRPQAIAVPL